MGERELMLPHPPTPPTPPTLPACPMPNAQCPIPTTNDSIDLGSIVEKNKCLQSYLTSGSWVYSLV